MPAMTDAHRALVNMPIIGIEPGMVDNHVGRRGIECTGEHFTQQEPQYSPLREDQGRWIFQQVLDRANPLAL